MRRVGRGARRAKMLDWRRQIPPATGSTA